MSAPGILICETTRGFVVAPACCDAPSTRLWCDREPWQRLPQRLAEACQSLATGTRKAVLATGGHSTLFASFPVDASVGRLGREALHFQLEAELPLDAEQFVADFRHSDTEVYAVAIESETWTPVITELEHAGIRVEHVVPRITLWLNAALRRERIGPDSLSLWSQPSHADLVHLVGGRIQNWRRLPAGGERIGEELRVIRDRFPGSDSLAVFSIIDAVGEIPEAESETDSQHRGGPTHEASITDASLADSEMSVRFERDPVDEGCEAARLIKRQSRPLFDLRRGPLAAHDPARSLRSEQRRFVAAAVVALIAVVSSLGWKAWQYERVAKEQDLRVRQAFQTAFPDQRVPRSVLARLRSARRGAAGATRVAEDLDLPNPALGLVRRVVAALPVDTPFRVDEIRVTDGRFVAQIEVASIADAGQIALSLQKAGLEMNPPSTSATAAGRVAVRIEGLGTAEGETTVPAL